MGQIVAVITGDLIRSSVLADAERVRFHEWLAGLPAHLDDELGMSSDLSVDSFRGDGWQVLVPQFEFSVRVALYMRAWLRASYPQSQLDARMGIGLGSQELPANFQLASADGPAFRRSGAALEASYSDSRLQIRLPGMLKGFTGESFQVLLTLIDEISKGWTGKQAQAIMGALRGQIQEQIGAGWPDGGISQQAVGQHLVRAGWGSISSALDFFEAWLPGLITSEPKSS